VDPDVAADSEWLGDEEDDSREDVAEALLSGDAEDDARDGAPDEELGHRDPEQPESEEQHHHHADAGGDEADGGTSAAASAGGDDVADLAGEPPSGECAEDHETPRSRDGRQLVVDVRRPQVGNAGLAHAERDHRPDSSHDGRPEMRFYQLLECAGRGITPALPSLRPSLAERRTRPRLPLHS
jgi:hypothetical protein